MRILRLIPLLFLAIVLSSCNTLRGSYIDETERTVEFLLADMPLPPDTEFVEDPIIMGTGGGVTGKIVLHSPVSPITNLDFYTSVSKTSGWRLVASTISKKIDLTYRKGQRLVNVEMVRQNDRIGVLFGGENDTIITITVALPDISDSRTDDD
jgi:hypothetical protein|tara:strand:- start:6192 stop:6650 length:459 start_codon:yes stop_codon:yes gene_type:complete